MKLHRRSFLKCSGASLAGYHFLRSALWAASVPTDSMGEAKFVDVDGIRTRYFDRGSGEAVVLVHGGNHGTGRGGYGAETWTEIFDGLAQHFHVYAFDKLGMGYTDNPKRDEDYNIRATVQHAYRFMQTVGIRKVHLAGSSRGALPVARIAVDHPEMVKSLILFNSSTVAPGDPSAPVDFLEADRIRQESEAPTKESIRRELEDQPLRYHKVPVTDERVEKALKEALMWYSMPKMKEARQKMQMLRSQFIERYPERVRQDPSLAMPTAPTPWWIEEVKKETHAMIKAGRLKAPTLIIWGMHDPEAPLIIGIHTLDLVAPVTRAEMHIFKEAGHSSFEELPRQVNRLLIDFMKEASSN